MATDPSSKLTTDRLALVYLLSKTFNSSLDLEDVLNTVMDEVVTVTRAERGFVVLRNDSGRLDFRAARGVEQETIDQPEFQISRGVIESVVREGGGMLNSDA